jgi:hypothetical protein
MSCSDPARHTLSSANPARAARKGVHENVMFLQEAVRPGERAGSFCLVGSGVVPA